MATAIAMDIDECEAAAKGKAAASLSINKSSAGKISKSASSSMRRPGSIVQPSKPMPTSRVYNTDRTNFRELVQQLTGNSTTTGSGGGGASGGSGAGGIGTSLQQQQTPAGFSHQGMNPSMVMGGVSSQQQQHQHQHFQQQQSLSVVTDPASPVSSGSGGVLSPHSSARPVNSRLQRMAPPPLRPTFSFSFAQKLAQQQQRQELGESFAGEVNSGGGAANHPAGASATAENLTSPGAQPLSPLSNKRVSTMPLLSFSPLPVLSPSDTAWASFESPNTAAMKQLAQSIIDGSNKNASFVGSRFPWSPTFQGCLGLPSPGLPELFPDVKMIDSPANAAAATTTAAATVTATNASSNDFSFPEIRDS